jgi:hypothetical protein
MYWIFMGVAVPVLAIGWIAYWLYMRKVREEEKNRPKPVSKRLTQTRSEVVDWAKKMAEFEPPKRKFSGKDNEKQADQ